MRPEPASQAVGLRDRLLSPLDPTTRLTERACLIRFIRA